MGKVIVQVYRCGHCNKIFEVQSFGVYFPACPFCGKSAPYHLATKTIETN